MLLKGAHGKAHPDGGRSGAVVSWEWAARDGGGGDMPPWLGGQGAGNVSGESAAFTRGTLRPAFLFPISQG